MKEDKYKKNYKEVFEYEDYGTPTMYLAAIGTVVIALALAVLFAMIVAGGFVAVGSAINGQ